MFWDVKSDLTDALYIVVSTPMWWKFLWFCFYLYLGIYHLWLHIYLCQQYVKHVYIQINKLVFLSYVKLLEEVMWYSFFFNHWVCIKYLTNWCLVGYDLEATLFLIFTRCFTGGVSASRDKEDINVNFIYLITSGRFDKRENSIFW